MTIRGRMACLVGITVAMVGTTVAALHVCHGHYERALLWTQHSMKETKLQFRIEAYGSLVENGIAGQAGQFEKAALLESAIRSDLAEVVELSRHFDPAEQAEESRLMSAAERALMTGARLAALYTAGQQSAAREGLTEQFLPLLSQDLLPLIAARADEEATGAAEWQQKAMRVVQLTETTGLTAALLLAILLAAMAYSTSRHLLGMIRQLESGLKAVSQGQLTHRLPAGRHDELGRLTDLFNEMSDALFRTHDMGEIVLNSTPDHILILDTHDYRVLSANRAFLESCGLPRGQVLGKTCYELTHGRSSPCCAPDDACPIAEMKSTRQRIRVEHRHRSPGGQERVVEVSVDPMIDPSGTIDRVVHVALDITELRHREQTLVTMQKLDSLGVMAGGIAHDFNNILTAILGNLSLLQTGMPAGSESLDLVREAQAACGTAKGLSNQLLTFAKGGNPVIKVVDLKPLLKQVAGFAARGSNSRLVFELGQGPLAARIDEDQFSQVVQNLVINAKQAMPQGGAITIGASTVSLADDELPPLAAGRYVRLTVQDEGSGIATAHLPRIFDPYFSTKATGRGLGLSVCYSIMARHGGLIGASSEPGAGAVFSLHFPAADAADLPREAELPAPTVDTGRVLIMDDEAAVARVLKRMLGRLGYQIETVADGQAALDAYRLAQEAGHPFDVVIMDLTIPGWMGGQETIGKLIALDPKVKAIVSSGYAIDSVMANFADYGFCAALGKPYSLENISSALRQVIGSKAS